MDLHIDIEVKDGVLWITARGTVQFEVVSRHFKQVWDAAQANNIDKILLDCLAVDGELAIFERYDLGVEVAADLKQRGMALKLAFVGKLPAMNGFGVRVARNRGVTAEVFSTQLEAVKWLNEY